MHPLILTMKILPKSFLSWLTGLIVRVKFPKPFQDLLNAKFVTIFGIDMSEAEKPLKDYRSIEDVFTRKLKPEARSLSSDMCSPCDGTLTISAPLDADNAIQAKGLYYDASELTFAMKRPAELSPLKAFTTIYLAPHNYHRVHSPVSGQVRNIRYIPGELWPVNDISVKYVPKVFTRNERLVFDIEAEKGGMCHLVMVGAFNVGRIQSPLLEDFTTNACGFTPGRFKHFQLATPVNLSIGDEVGTFMLGSTVVLVMDDSFVSNYDVLHTLESRSVKLGETILK